MTGLNLALLAGVSNQVLPAAQPLVGRVLPAFGAEGRFAASMNRAAETAAMKLAAADVAKQPVAAAQAGVEQVSASGEVERARKTLDIAPAAKDAVKPVGSGDAILDGLQKLRSVFDVQQGKLNTALNSRITDANTLIGLQVEVVNFSLLVDVTSKLTGKSTQAIETLMKGQ